MSKYPMIYDNGGKSFDRYTAIFNSAGDYLAMSENPTYPQGFGQHGEGCKPGKHLGKRIKLEYLPVDCQNLVNYDMYYITREILVNKKEAATRNFVVQKLGSKLWKKYGDAYIKACDMYYQFLNTTKVPLDL